MSLSRIRVAVLRGGPSREYEHSLATGAHVISVLHDLPQYEPLDIFISKDGNWHFEGLERPKRQILMNADVVFNALHGSYGEDGGLQRELEAYGVPFTGSSSVASALSMDKEMSKRSYAFHNLLTPRHELVRDDISDDQLLYIFRTYMHPVIVKPVHSGSSIGSKIAHSIHELEEAIRHALQYSKKVIVEEVVRGKEATCGVVENFRGQKLYSFLPLEVRKGESISPGSFTSEERKKITEMAREAHQALGLRHYSRSDFIITPQSRVYILETNSLPKFSLGSHMHTSLATVGSQPKEFVHHLITLALDK